MKTIKELENEIEALKKKNFSLEEKVEELESEIEDFEEKVEDQESGFYFPQGFNDNLIVRGLFLDLFENIDRINMKYLEELVNDAKV